MRLHFQETPWDIFVGLGYAASCAVILLTAGVKNPAVTLLVLFVPGYLLVAIIFPGKTGIGWTERIGMSSGAGIAAVALVGLLLKLTAWGVQLSSIIEMVTVLTVGVGAAAYWRRMQLPPEARLSLSTDFAMPAWKEQSALDKGLTIALVASITVTAGALGFVMYTPRPGERFTEFYILGPGGNASGYPTNLTPAEPGTVIVGMVNHEAATVAYAIRVDLVGVNIFFNASCNCNQTQEVNRTSLASFNQLLADSVNWTYRYTFSINVTGIWKVQFLLFKDGDFSSAYRELHLYVRVT